MFKHLVILYSYYNLLSDAQFLCHFLFYIAKREGDTKVIQRSLEGQCKGKCTAKTMSEVFVILYSYYNLFSEAHFLYYSFLFHMARRAGHTKVNVRSYVLSNVL